MHLGESVSIGKVAIREWIRAHFQPGNTVLDVGAGGGTYNYLLQDCGYVMDAIEVYEPATPYLINRYRTTYLMDATQFVFNMNYDLVIMGDVLEHVTIEQAQDFIQKALNHCRWLLVAIPFEYEQGAIEDNAAEAHIQDDLNLEVVQQRYPQLQLLLYIESDKIIQWDDGRPFNLRYAYYIAKGKLNE